MLAQTQVNIVHERTKFSHWFTPSCDNGFFSEMSSNCALGTSDVVSNVDNVRAVNAHLLYHEKVPSA